MDIENKEIKYKRIICTEASDKLLNECADLFTAHYGEWAPGTNKEGQRISRRGKDLRNYLPGEKSWIATARINGQLIGYGLAAVSPQQSGLVNWVTQLVVHSDYQNDLVGSTILRSIWGFSNHFAWGIASANPFAVRALEKATKRHYSHGYMKRSLPTVKKVLSEVSYLKDCDIELSRERCVINTSFKQDLSQLPQRLYDANAKRLWKLGNIKLGEEWLAVTFRDQRQERWTDKELEAFLRLSDDIAIEAYDRMAQADPQKAHSWASPERAESETSYLLNIFKLSSGQKVLDLGCGSGRHSIAMAKKGITAHGIDYSDVFLELAKKFAKSEGVNELATFSKADIRTLKLGEQYDAVICLYDVFGSSPENQSNDKIIETAIDHLRPGGWVALSAMSYEYTRGVAKYFLQKQNLDEAINKLPASDTMQKSGDVFHPDYMLVDEKEQVVYRKEEFGLGDAMPAELIVRDRRYTIEELKGLCKRFGLTIYSCGYIRAGNFSLVDKPSGNPTKEILLIAQKGVA